MITENQILNLGFKRISGLVMMHRVWTYKHDLTHLNLKNELGSGLFTLIDPTRSMAELWQGNLVKPVNLVRKLIQYGGNLSGAPDEPQVDAIGEDGSTYGERMGLVEKENET